MTTREAAQAGYTVMRSTIPGRMSQLELELELEQLESYSRAIYRQQQQQLHALLVSTVLWVQA